MDDDEDMPRDICDAASDAIQEMVRTSEVVSFMANMLSYSIPNSPAIDQLQEIDARLRVQCKSLREAMADESRRVMRQADESSRNMLLGTLAGLGMGRPEVMESVRPLIERKVFLP